MQLHPQSNVQSLCLIEFFTMFLVTFDCDTYLFSGHMHMKPIWVNVIERPVYQSTFNVHLDLTTLMVSLTLKLEMYTHIMQIFYAKSDVEVMVNIHMKL